MSTKRTKVTFNNVKMEILGQMRTVDSINLIIEEILDRNGKTIKASKILTFDEYRRVEEAEHNKIMEAHRGRKKPKGT